MSESGTSESPMSSSPSTPLRIPKCTVQKLQQENNRKLATHLHSLSQLLPKGS